MSSSDEKSSSKSILENDWLAGFFWIRPSGTPFFKWFSNDYFQMKWNQEDLFFTGFLSALNSSSEVFFDGDLLRYIEFEVYKLFLMQIKNGDLFTLITSKECPDSLAKELIQKMKNYFDSSTLTTLHPAEKDNGVVEKVYLRFLSELDNTPHYKELSENQDLIFTESNRSESTIVQSISNDHDITNLKQNLLNMEMQVSSMSKLSRMIGHELNNVLSTIVGNINLAEMDIDYSDPNHQILKEAENACDKAQKLTFHLLNIAKRIGKNSSASTISVNTENFNYTKEKNIRYDNILEGKGNILLLDDNREILQTTKKMLTRLGYTTDIAHSLQQALSLYQIRLIKERPYDAVILDLSELGGIGGFGALIWQKIDPNINAIVSSGYANDPVFSQYLRHGFLGALQKPYDIRELSHVLHDVIHNKSNTILPYYN
jgi:CheY-like chemotaxis protein